MWAEPDVGRRPGKTEASQESIVSQNAGSLSILATEEEDRENQTFKEAQ